ncbi:sigma-54 interaction domain-containing protein [Paraburkholderia sp. BCC1886]|uniref:sigma-54 interaction domain-containing protein n=1 Tax=Paraburkholderia sp. BCC1886 TaxID=2562670 RepID=UPI001181C975|nr:sigma 54-interacting transcriptional regulator [Paraburkholderia sp. BCC1886]
MMNDWAGLPAAYGDVLRRAMDSLFRTFENFSEGTFIVDAEARVVWINKRYAARFGFADPGQAIGRDCEAVIPNSLMREVVSTGKPILLDILETDREPLVVTRLPLKDDAGVTVGAVGFALFDELKALTPLFSHYSRVQAELIATRQSLAQARQSQSTFASFVGSSPASLEVKRQARRAALLEAPVLLLGETGTGKALLAQAIHGASARASQSLVTVHLAATPAAALEVELFGAAPDTPADAAQGVESPGRAGKLELANGGTLFLDEIGELPLPLQGKLLRVLQDQAFELPGTNRSVRVDLRIIAATSLDLPALVASGRFRADLFYRLNVLTLHAPPLRERTADIEALSYAMLEDLANQTRGRAHFELADDALRLLCAYDWPGNVRELRNTLERAVMVADSERIDARLLAPVMGSTRAGNRPAAPPALGEAAPGKNAAPEAFAAASWSDAMAAFEKRFLTDALRASGGRVSEAATRIGMGRATLYKKIAAYGIEVETDR